MIHAILEFQPWESLGSKAAFGRRALQLNEQN
jgi:hypothetical protein